MATKLVRESLSAINTGINYVPMGSWTLHRVQDVYNKVKDTSPEVVAKSLDRVESVVQQFIVNPEDASIDADSTENDSIQSLKLPETLTDEQLELLNQFLVSMITEKERRENDLNPKRSDPEPQLATKIENPMKILASRNDNSQLEEYPNNSGHLEKRQNLTQQQLEWSKQMLGWVSVGFFAVHTGFQDIICEMERENDRCSKYGQRKPYYMKLTTVMSHCVMDWLMKNDFLDIMMKFFNTVSLTGDILRSYISLGQRMVQICKEKMLIEIPAPQEQKEIKQKEQ